MPLDYDRPRGAKLLALYEPELWPDLTAPRAAAAALQVLHTRLGASRQENYPYLLEGQYGVFCSDSDNPATVGAWKRAARSSDRRFPYFGRPWTWYSSLCQPWPGQDADRYTGPFTARTSNPVLIVGNRFDPASRYQGAVTLSGCCHGHGCHRPGPSARPTWCHSPSQPPRPRADCRTAR